MTSRFTGWTLNHWAMPAGREIKFLSKWAVVYTRLPQDRSLLFPKHTFKKTHFFNVKSSCGSFASSSTRSISTDFRVCKPRALTEQASPPRQRLSWECAGQSILQPGALGCLEGVPNVWPCSSHSSLLHKSPSTPSSPSVRGKPSHHSGCSLAWKVMNQRLSSSTCYQACHPGTHRQWRLN